MAALWNPESFPFERETKSWAVVVVGISMVLAHYMTYIWHRCETLTKNQPPVGGPA